MKYKTNKKDRFKSIQASEGGQLKIIQAMSGLGVFVWAETYSIDGTRWGGAKSIQASEKDHFKMSQAKEGTDGGWMIQNDPS